MTVTAYGQVEFNSLLMPSSVYEIQSIEGLADYPVVRTSDSTLLSRHGSYGGNDLLGGRKVTITVAIHASTVAAFATAVAAFRAAFTPAIATFPLAGGPVTYPGDYPMTFRLPGIAANANAILGCRVRRMSLLVDSKWNTGFAATAVVELFANDPVIYSETQHTASFSINAGSAVCANAGNWPSLFQIALSSVTGPLTGTTVTNITGTAKHLTLEFSYASGDLITIRPDERRVIYDANPVGGTLVDHYSKLSADSKWFALNPGNNTIQGSRTAGAATVTVYWFDSWI